MTRPNQHSQIDGLLKSDPSMLRIWRAISRSLLAPPNLQFAGAILQRLALLCSLEDHFGDVVGVFEQRADPKSLLDYLRSHADELEPETAAALFRLPGRGDGKHLSPLNRYCLSEYPTWCALTLSSMGGAPSAFDLVAAAAIGEVLRYTSERVGEASYRDFLEAWQQRRETENRMSIPRVEHPLAAKIGAVAKVERLLRALSTPEHHEAWTTFSEKPSEDQVNPLDDPASWAIGYPETRRLLTSLNSALETMEAESGRAGRRLTRLRRDPHFLCYGPGCFTRGLDWVVHLPEVANGQPVNTSIDILRPSVHRLLIEDFPLEELSMPSGAEVYAPDEESSRLATSALEVRTAWQHHVQQWNNQILPWSRAAISIPQLVVFLQAMYPKGEDRTKLTDPALLFRMLRCAAFNTGLSVKTLQSELAIAIDKPTYLRSRVEYLWERRLFRVAVNMPILIGREDDPDTTAGARIRNFIHIPDRIGFHHFAKSWIERHGENQKLIPLRLPAGAPPAARDEATTRLSASGLTDTLIQQALPRTVHSESDDLASIALWGDWDPAHTRTLRHYLSPPAYVIERPIDVALIKLIQAAKARHAGVLIPFVDEPIHIEGRRLIGAPDCPTSSEIAGLIADYRHRLSEDPGDSVDALRRYHDAYTTWMAFFQAAALGYRASIDPSPELLRIGERWFAIFADKDSGGFHRRIVPVPTVFVAQQRFFEEHRRLIGSIEALQIKASAAKMLMLSGGRPTDFRPVHAKKDAAGIWPYRINALRRRMRTRLLERGAPGEPSDIWMGHWFVGNCAWMEGSGFVMADLTRLVDEHITPILLEDGWGPIRSRLTAGLPWATT